MQDEEQQRPEEQGPDQPEEGTPEEQQAEEQAAPEEAPPSEGGSPEEGQTEPAAKKKEDVVPGAELDPIAIEPERELDAEERARREAEEEERLRRERELIGDVDVRRVGRLALAAQHVRDLGREAAEGLALRIDDVPVPLAVLGRRLEGLDRSRSHKKSRAWEPRPEDDSHHSRSGWGTNRAE